MADAVYLVRDLLFVSKIGEAADHLRVPLQGARTAEQLASVAPGSGLVIIDLGHPEALRALELLAGDPRTSGIPSIGFVGHEQLDLMETAKALGCGRVLAKGQLAAELPRLFDRLKAATA